MRKIIGFCLVVMIILLAGCTMPDGNEEEGDLDPTSMAIVEMTVAAVQEGSDSGSDNGDNQADDTDAVDPTLTPTAAQQDQPDETEEPDATDEADDDDEDDGLDQARFVSDVTIPDYAVVDAGDVITKTWRLQNVGTSTWTTDYALVFDDEDQMGAPDRVQLTAEVPPDGYINISVDFTVPNADGEYSSYWMLEDEDGNSFGTGDEFDQPIWMIITVGTGDNLETGSSPEGVAGGAPITNASVSADPVNYNGSCPAQVDFTYTVTTSSSGLVLYRLIFTTVSPSGYVFDPPEEYSQVVGGATTLSLPYLLISSDSVVATARVKAIGSNTFVSPPLQFTVTCN
jgi:hypothetical protein